MLIRRYRTACVRDVRRFVGPQGRGPLRGVPSGCRCSPGEKLRGL